MLINNIFTTIKGKEAIGAVVCSVVTSIENTVGLGTMAQHARVWALPVAKLVGQSKIASNITLGKLIGLHHIQSLLLYNKNCGLQPSKHSFFRPHLKGLSRLVRRPKPQNSAISQPIRMRFGVSMYLW